MSDTHNTVSPRGRWIGAALTLAVSAFVFWTYHDQFWYAPDEGNYAHVAQRVLEGEVLHRDVQDAHMGYINFANAGWMWLFGERLLSLRYPLIAIGVLSALAAYLLTGRERLFTGLAAGLIVATLSIIQFLNPTAHWYCFGLVWAVIACLTWRPPGSRKRLFFIGFLVGLVFLFRQLTGVFVAMGVLAYLLIEAGREPERADSSASSRRAGLWTARLLCAIMFCGLIGYLLAKTDTLTLVMYGCWPLALLGVIGWRSTVAARTLATILGLVGCGALVSAVPLIAYHTLHGSLTIWLDDTLFRAEALTRLDFIHRISFPQVLNAALGELTASDGPVRLLNAIFWIVALSAAPLLGLCSLFAARRADARNLSPLIVIALFYSVVSLHYQIPIYLFYSLSLTLVALLQIARGRHGWSNSFVIAGVVLAVIGLHHHAAQPLTRGWDGILGGVRADAYVASSNPRCGLDVPGDDEAVYAEICRRIDEHCAPEDAVFALPSNAEIYFLSGRRNPFRFFNSALDLTSEDDVLSAVNRLRSSPPKLVFYRPEDKYNTRESLALMDWVRATYRPLPPIGGFEVYRYDPDSIAALD